MAAHIRHVALRLFNRNGSRITGVQQSRAMCFMQTYKEKYERKPKEKFVNPLQQPKLKEITIDDIEKVLAAQPPMPDTDMPISTLPNPYQKAAKRCVLCEHDVQLEYKNTRLLSQFVSPHTGLIYGRHITGLCLYMQWRVEKLITRARFFGFLPYVHKHSPYMKDPKLFDAFKRLN